MAVWAPGGSPLFLFIALDPLYQGVLLLTPYVRELIQLAFQV